MDTKASRRDLIAIDTNVLLDLADEIEDVLDAVLVIRQRLPLMQLLMLPTVREELAEEALNAEEADDRERGLRAFQLARLWSISPIDLTQSQFEKARRISLHLRNRRLLPPEEANDGSILAESALLGCSVLLTSDEHLRGMDFERLTFELQAFELAAPVIATPREIVRKFFH